MKKIIFLILLLITFSATAQKVGVDVIKFQGNVTTTIRDAYDVPTGEYWMIYNTTTAQLEVAADDDVWSAFSVGTDDQDASEVPFTPYSTIAATDTQAAIQEVLDEAAAGIAVGDIDTSAEIAAIVTDETGSGALAFATSPTLVTPNLGTPSAGVMTNVTGIVTGGLVDGTILEVDLNATNAPTDNYVLSYNLGGTNFTWVDPTVIGFGTYLPLAGGTMTGNISMPSVAIDDSSEIKSERFQAGGVNDAIGGGNADVGWQFDPQDTADAFDNTAYLSILGEQSGGAFSEYYTLRWGGVPTQNTDLADKLYVDTAAAAGGTDDQTAAEVTYSNATSTLTATDVQAAIDETKGITDTNGSGISTLGSDVSTLAAVPASQFGIAVKTVDYTLVANDALDSLMLSLNYNNEAITIPSGVFSEGQSIRLFKHNSATNETRIIEGSGVSLVGFSDGITLGTYPSGATITRTSSATSPEEWEITDYFGTIADYAAATLGSELLTNGDDFSSGWTYQNGSSATAGVATAIGSGTLISDAGNHVVYQNITALTNGTDYRITITWRRTVGSGDAYVGIKFIHQQTVAGLSASFVEQTFDFTAGASGEDRIAIGAASGTTLEIDSISLKEIL